MVISHPNLIIVQKESPEIELDFVNQNSRAVSQLLGWFDELDNEIDPSRRLIGTFENEYPQKNNHYVKIIPPQVDENCLPHIAGWHGPIASI